MFHCPARACNSTSGQLLIPRMLPCYVSGNNTVAPGLTRLQVRASYLNYSSSIILIIDVGEVPQPNIRFRTPTPSAADCLSTPIPSPANEFLAGLCPRSARIWSRLFSANSIKSLFVLRSVIHPPLEAPTGRQISNTSCIRQPQGFRLTNLTSRVVLLYVNHLLPHISSGIRLGSNLNKQGSERKEADWNETNYGNGFESVLRVTISITLAESM